jgi:hypothetical protein
MLELPLEASVNKADLQEKIKNKWVLALLALFGISLISAGVFASATITLNSGNAVNLGAGAAPVSACQTNATVSAIQSLDSTDQVYKLTTVTLALNTDRCIGKTLGLAFKAGTQTYSTTWSVASGGSNTFSYGLAGSGIDITANDISTIAVSAQ